MENREERESGSAEFNRYTFGQLKTVDKKLATELIERQFKKIKVSSIKAITNGFDNKTYLINNQYIFRFPKTKAVAYSLDFEKNVLPWLGHTLGTTIPKAEFIGEPSPGFKYAFMGYTKLPHRSLREIQPSPRARKKYIKAIALFLKELHNHHLGNVRGPLNEFEKFTCKRQSLIQEEESQGFLKKLKAATGKNSYLPDELCRLISKHRDNLEAMITISSLHARSTQRNLIHGDFCERHVLVSRNGSLEGVIDWGRARLSNPSKDLEFIHSFFPKNQHEEFFKHYGDVSDATWQQALLSSMHSSLILVEHAVTHNIKHIYKSTFQALNFVLENPTDI